MNVQQALSEVIEGRDLTELAMTSVMNSIMSGEATDAQIGGFLVGLRMKGETIDEIVGAARVMRELSTKVEISGEHLVDTCGTGGDGANLFNVSTASAFVVAAAGGRVAKHGNRSVSSSTGSADVLEAAGVNLAMSPERVARAVEGLGVGFMFAPAHHGAMKHAIGPRKELAQRTVFNVLGPLTNPAGVKSQVIGVFSRPLCRPLAEVLGRLGSEHVIVVHSAEGLDEFSIAGSNHVAELKDGAVSEYEVSTSDVGLDGGSLDGLCVSTAEESLALIKGALTGGDGEVYRRASQIIAMNAGAAIYVSGLAGSLSNGVRMAEDAIASGLAYEKIKELAEFSNV